MKFKWLSLGITVLILVLLSVQLYTSFFSRSLHEEWHTHLEAGHTQIAEEISVRRDQILSIHVVSGYLTVLLVIILAFLIVSYWKT